MRRIEIADNAVLDSGTSVPVFKEQSPLSDGTKMRDYWFNSVQEEIATVIESSGDILDPGSWHQLRDSIKRNHIISSNLTIVVPNDFGTIQLALDSLYGRYIAPGVTVTIQLQPFLFNITTPILVSHAQSDQITIKGANPGGVLTDFTIQADTTGWLEFDSVFKLSGRGLTLKGLTLKEKSTSTRSQSVYGIYARGRSIVTAIECRIQDFTGSLVCADQGGTVILQSSILASPRTTGLTTREAGVQGNGAFARYTGQIIAKGNTITGCPNGSGAYCAEKAGVIYCDGGTADGSIVSRDSGVFHGFSISITAASRVHHIGYWAKQNGYMYLESCYVSGATNAIDIGFFAISGSRIYANACVNSGNMIRGFYALDGSGIFGDNNIANNCTTGYLAENLSIVSGLSNTGTGTTTLKTPATGTANTTNLSRMD